MKPIATHALLCGLFALISFGATALDQEKKAEPKPPLLVIDVRAEAWEIMGAALSPDGKRLVTGHFSGYGDSSPVCVWDTTTGKKLLRIIHAHKRGGCKALAFSPDGKRIASGGEHLGAKVWDAQTGKLLLTLEHNAHSIAFSPDGKRIITGNNWYTVKVWDAETGKEVFDLEAKPYAKEVTGARGIAVSPDGKRIARGGYDNKIKIWDAETGKEVLHFPAKVGMHIAFSPDSKRIVSAYSGYYLQIRGERVDDETVVTVWDAETGKELLALERPKSEIFGCAAFSPDGKWIVTGGYDRTEDRTEKKTLVKVWDAATGREVASFRPKKSDGGVESVAFTPDGNRIVASCFWTVQVWAFEKP